VGGWRYEILASPMRVDVKQDGDKCSLIIELRFEGGGSQINTPHRESKEAKAARRVVAKFRPATKARIAAEEERADLMAAMANEPIPSGGH